MSHPLTLSYLDFRLPIGGTKEWICEWGETGGCCWRERVATKWRYTYIQQFSRKYQSANSSKLFRAPKNRTFKIVAYTTLQLQQNVSHMCRQRSFFPPEILLWHQKHIWEVGCSNFQKMWANTSPPRERDEEKIPPPRVWNFEPEGKHICIPALEKKITHLHFKERTISWLYCFLW